MPNPDLDLKVKSLILNSSLTEKEKTNFEMIFNRFDTKQKEQIFPLLFAARNDLDKFWRILKLKVSALKNELPIEQSADEIAKIII